MILMGFNPDQREEDPPAPKTPTGGWRLKNTWFPRDGLGVYSRLNQDPGSGHSRSIGPKTPSGVGSVQSITVLPVYP